jgi:hypothetical protein
MCVYRCIRVALSERKGLLYDCEKTSRWFQYTVYQNLDLHLYGLISGRVAEESRPCQWTLVHSHKYCIPQQTASGSLRALCSMSAGLPFSPRQLSSCQLDMRMEAPIPQIRVSASSCAGRLTMPCLCTTPAHHPSPNSGWLKELSWPL